MAYAIVHQFPGGTKKQYEASLAAVHPSPDSVELRKRIHRPDPTTCEPIRHLRASSCNAAQGGRLLGDIGGVRHLRRI